MLVKRYCFLCLLICRFHFDIDGIVVGIKQITNVIYCRIDGLFNLYLCFNLTYLYVSFQTEEQKYTHVVNLIISLLHNTEGKEEISIKSTEYTLFCKTYTFIIP